MPYPLATVFLGLVGPSGGENGTFPQSSSACLTQNLVVQEMRDVLSRKPGELTCRVCKKGVIGPFAINSKPKSCRIGDW